jgi:hypothetical protein
LVVPILSREENAPIARQLKPKTEVEAMLIEALRRISGQQPRKVEVTRADPALYGANWAATGIRGSNCRKRALSLVSDHIAGKIRRRVVSRQVAENEPIMCNLYSMTKTKDATAASPMITPEKVAGRSNG